MFTGTFATNPASGEPVPIFVADYVLATYGGGAIMAVPAHDQRDFEFARAFGLPVRAVVRPDRRWLEDHPGAVPDRAETWSEASLDEGVAINSHSGRLSLDGLGRAEATARTIRWLEESGNGRRRVSYRLRDWLFSRQRYWGEPFPIVYDETGLPIALPESLLPVELPPMSDFRPQATEGAEPRPPLSRAPGFEQATLDLGDGPKTYRRETNVMPQWAGSCWYYLRYLDPANDERFVDPAVERFWMDDAPGEERAGGVDLYIGGVEHAVLHLLYARFWHKVLFDLGYVSTPEPFQRLYNQGYILADAFTDPAGRYVPAAEVVGDADGGWRHHGQPVTRHAGKMGKSLKNAVSPDDIYEAYGADTLRMYEMAMGPLDVDRAWQPDDIVGVFRFLQRLWRNVDRRDDRRGAGLGGRAGERRAAVPPAAPDHRRGRLPVRRAAIQRRHRPAHRAQQRHHPARARPWRRPRDAVEALVSWWRRWRRTSPPSSGSGSGTMASSTMSPSGCGRGCAGRVDHGAPGHGRRAAARRGQGRSCGRRRRGAPGGAGARARRAAGRRGPGGQGDPCAREDRQHRHPRGTPTA